MVFRIAHEFLMIGKESLGFSKNYFYEWDDGLGGHPSQLFLNIHIDSTEIPGDEIADEMFEVMKNYFFHDLSRSAGGRFEDCLKEVNEVVRKKEETLGVKFIPNMNVIAAAVCDNTLYLSQHGEAEAYLVRRRYVSTISEGLSDPKNKEELFANISNGDLSASDYLLMCSSRLVRYVTKGDLGKLISDEPDLKTALGAVKDAVSVDVMDRLNILAVRVGERMEETVVEGDDAAPAKAVGGFLPKIGDTLKLHLGKLMPERGGKVEKVEEDVEDSSEEVREKASAVLDDGAEGTPKKSPKVSEWTHLLQEWKELKRDKILVALVLVVVVLVVGIYLVRNQGRKQQLIDDLEGKLELVELNINTAKTTGSYDKTSAKELLDEAEIEALDVLNSGYLRGKASEYLTGIETQRDLLDNVVRIETPTVFADFSIDNPGMNALGVVPFGDSLYVYEYNQLYQVILGDIQPALTIDVDEVVVDAAYFEEDESILFLTKSNRVIEFKDEQFSFVDTDDGSWHSAVDLEVYNNRIYLLDPMQGQVWRYYQQRSGYSGADGYVVDEAVDITDGASFAIDGSVFVLKDDGELLRLLSGENSAFQIKNAPTTDLSDATKIYTELEMFQVFVLDPVGSRVFMFNKDSRTGNLVYSSQYILDTEETLHDIYADKEANRLYVVGETKVFEVSY